MARRSPTSAGRGKTKPLQAAIWITLAVVFVGVFIWDLGWPSSDNDTVVPPPEPGDRAAVVSELARATAVQGICYGWRLTSEPVSVGSNLGDGVAVEGRSECPRWLKITAMVGYTPAESELADSAELSITSDGLGRAVIPKVVELTRFGITEDTFIDDPGEAISRAVLTLPLLASEHRLAPPVPPPGAAPANPPASSGPAPSGPAASITASPPGPTNAPADAGNLADTSGDLWRDRGPVLAFGGLALVAGVAVALWTWLRLRRTAARAATPPVPAKSDPLPPVPTRPARPRPKRRPPPRGRR